MFAYTPPLMMSLIDFISQPVHPSADAEERDREREIPLSDAYVYTIHALFMYVYCLYARCVFMTENEWVFDATVNTCFYRKILMDLLCTCKSRLCQASTAAASKHTKHKHKIIFTILLSFHTLNWTNDVKCRRHVLHSLRSIRAINMKSHRIAYSSSPSASCNFPKMLPSTPWINATFDFDLNRSECINCHIFIWWQP